MPRQCRPSDANNHPRDSHPIILLWSRTMKHTSATSVVQVAGSGAEAERRGKSAGLATESRVLRWRPDFAFSLFLVFR